MGGHVLGHHGSGGHEGVPADHVAANHRDVGAQGSPLLDAGRDELLTRERAGGAGAKIIREGGVRAHKDVVCQADSIPDLHTVLDHYPITHHRAFLDECLATEVAVAPDPGTCHDVSSRPDPCPGADLGALA